MTILRSLAALLSLAVLWPSSAAAQSFAFGSSAPPALVDVTRQIQQAGAAVHDVEILQSGHWVVVGDGHRAYSSFSTFDSIGLRPAVEALLSKGQTIFALEVTAAGRWVIYSSMGFSFSDSVIRQQLFGHVLQWMHLAGWRFSEIEISDAGGVVIVRDDGTFYRWGVHPAGLDEALDDCLAGARPIHEVSIAGDHWIVAADRWFAHSAPPNLGPFTSFVRNFDFGVDELALRSDGAFLIVSDGPYAPPAGNAGAAFEGGFGANDHVWNRLAFHDVPGAQVALIQNGQVIWERGYGTAQIGSGDRVRPQHVFAVASLSKMIGAMTAMAVVDDGLLDLDSPVTDVAAANPGSDLATWVTDVGGSLYVNGNGVGVMFSADGQKLMDVTLQRALSHTAGLNLSGFGQQPLASQASVADILLGNSTLINGGARVDFAINDVTPAIVGVPGTAYNYSGGGITVAEAMVEAVTGQTLAQAAQQRLFGPLGLTRTSFATTPPALMVDYARGHDAAGNVLAIESCSGKAAGGLLSTAGEYARMVALLINQGQANGQQILSPGAVADLLRPATVGEPTAFCGTDADCGAGELCQRNAGNLFGVCFARPINQDAGTPARYGLGVGIGPLNTAQVNGSGWRDSFSHNGSHPSDGYFTRFHASVGRRMGVVVLTNGVRCTNGTAATGCNRGAQAFTNEAVSAFQAAYGWNGTAP